MSANASAAVVTLSPLKTHSPNLNRLQLPGYEGRFLSAQYSVF